MSEEALLETTARELATEKVVGWFQGRMEFGPRAFLEGRDDAHDRGAALGDLFRAAVACTRHLEVLQRGSFKGRGFIGKNIYGRFLLCYFHPIRMAATACPGRQSSQEAGSWKEKLLDKKSGNGLPGRSL